MRAKVAEMPNLVCRVMQAFGDQSSCVQVVDLVDKSRAFRAFIAGNLLHRATTHDDGALMSVGEPAAPSLGKVLADAFRNSRVKIPRRSFRKGIDTLNAAIETVVNDKKDVT